MEQTNKHFFLLSTMTGCRTAYAKGLLGYEALLTQGLGFCPVLIDTLSDDEINQLSTILANILSSLGILPFSHHREIFTVVWD